MRPYDSSHNGDESIEHAVAFPNKHTNELTAEQLPKQKPIVRAGTKWIILDALLLFSLAAGCSYFYYTKATSSAREISAKLQEDQIELSWTRQHVEELEDRFEELEDEFEGSSQIEGEEDDTFNFQRTQRRLLDAQHIIDLELEHAHEENTRLKMDIFLAHNERINSEHSQQMNEDTDTTASSSSTGRLRGTPEFKYRIGDIVEFVDPNLNPTQDREAAEAHLLAPHKIVLSRRYAGAAIYDVVCSVNGRKKGLPEKYLRPYVPYRKDTKALCNMGTFEVARFLECTVVDYMARAERGVMVLQGQYSVVVAEVHGQLQRQVSLPVWKVERLPDSSSSSSE